MYGWTSPFVEPIPMQDDGWCGQLTLPREIMLVAESGSLTVTSLTLHHLKSIGLDKTVPSLHQSRQRNRLSAARLSCARMMI